MVCLEAELDFDTLILDLKTQIQKSGKLVDFLFDIKTHSCKQGFVSDNDVRMREFGWKCNSCGSRFSIAKFTFQDGISWPKEDTENMRKFRDIVRDKESRNNFMDSLGRN